MLDMRLKREGNSITTDIYIKPIHTDQYLLWSSHHPIQQNLGMVRTLMHRVDTLIADEERRKIEMGKVRVALRTFGYLEWALKEGEVVEETGEKGARATARYDQVEEKKCKQYAVLPFIKGVTKRLHRAFRKHIALYAKVGFNIRNAVVSLKNALDLGEQCGVI